jgi:predicted transcriptional regulator
MMKKMEVEFLPVVASEDENRLVGMLERPEIHKAITRELIRRHQIAQGELEAPA